MISSATVAQVLLRWHRSVCGLRLGTVAIILLAAMTPLPSQAASVSLTPVVLHLESDVTIDTGTTPLGSVSMDITYNPAVFTIEAISPGSTAEFSHLSTSTSSYSSGLTHIANYSLTPVTGVVNVARIRFRAVPNATGTESPIGAANVFLLGPNSVPISAGTPSGFKAKVSGRCLLDIDSDNVVIAARDAFSIYRTRLGIPSYSAAVRAANPGLPTDTAVREMVRQMCPTR